MEKTIEDFGEREADDIKDYSLTVKEKIRDNLDLDSDDLDYDGFVLEKVAADCGSCGGEALIRAAKIRDKKPNLVSYYCPEIRCEEHEEVDEILEELSK